MKKALILLDFLNDIVNPEGKLAGKGYGKYMGEYNIVKKVNKIIAEFRANGNLIIFVNVGFKKGYDNQPKNSPLFGKANEFGVLENGTWGTEIYEKINHNENDIIINKPRVSAFFETELNDILKENNIGEIYLAGCATDLVVEATARDGHDRDYNVNVFSDCCAAANIEDHNRSLKTISKIGNIITNETINLGK